MKVFFFRSGWNDSVVMPARICLSFYFFSGLPLLGCATEPGSQLYRLWSWGHGLSQPLSRLVQHQLELLLDHAHSVLDAGPLVPGFRFQLLGPSTCSEVGQAWLLQAWSHVQ